MTSYRVSYKLLDADPVFIKTEPLPSGVKDLSPEEWWEMFGKPNYSTKRVLSIEKVP